MFDVQASVQATVVAAGQIVLGELRKASQVDELGFDILVAIASFLAGVIGALIGLGRGVIIALARN
jgi:hypothetical protein